MKWTSQKRCFLENSKLQFDIDRMIKQAKDWNEFLRKCKTLDMKLSMAKHIAFKKGRQGRFMSKTIGEDYTEEKLKEIVS